MINAFNAGDKKTANAINAKLEPLVKSMFIETNPVPVKTAMGLLGMCAPDVRLPLCEMDEDNIVKLKSALQNYGLLKGQPV
jgi:4-hydroxy-tetrahydrodipicolinate synthase